MPKREPELLLAKETTTFFEEHLLHDNEAAGYAAYFRKTENWNQQEGREVLEGARGTFKKSSAAAMTFEKRIEGVFSAILEFGFGKAATFISDLSLIPTEYKFARKIIELLTVNGCKMLYSEEL